ncbi:aminopeptidase [Mycobacterium sp.]|uniref:aminopeptidase n=1 Tax=Mycobacterium sp. TaxID=1785 RepID=UPI002CABB397|nr:aminopeptidase [Mycobacterium sp.]HME47223.1 aminopeptidase [Mycobacterium sp.]
MTLRRLIVLAGAIVLIAGAVGLLVPVSVSGPSGETIGCGNAVASDLSAAQQADGQNLANLPVINQIVPHTSYVADCQSALSHRRAWSIPLAVLGVIVIIGAFVIRGGAGRLGKTGGGHTPMSR